MKYLLFFIYRGIMKLRKITKEKKPMVSYKFISFRTFYKNRHYIRERYKNMTYQERLNLKHYLYSIAIITTQHKDLIWEYLNEPIGSPYYVYNNQLRRQYMRAKI